MYSRTGQRALGEVAQGHGLPGAEAGRTGRPAAWLVSGPNTRVRVPLLSAVSEDWPDNSVSPRSSCPILIERQCPSAHNSRLFRIAAAAAATRETVEYAAA